MAAIVFLHHLFYHCVQWVLYPAFFGIYINGHFIFGRYVAKFIQSFFYCCQFLLLFSTELFIALYFFKQAKAAKAGYLNTQRLYRSVLAAKFKRLNVLLYGLIKVGFSLL